jgi:tetratricopeptide (TPR) repeat protein
MSVPKRPQEPARGYAFMAGLIGVAILILLGGGHNQLALGMALILPGLALVIRPPAVSLGKWIDIGIFGFLGSLLFAFLPLFYWYTPTWRRTAEEAFAIELPALLGVQSMVGFEAFLLALAGFAWLYAASSWKINHAGRSRFYLWVSCVIAGFAAVTIWGNSSGWRYPGAESSTAFSFFPNRNQMANFLAIGGVVTFGYGMEGLRGRKVLNMLGFLATALCLIALIFGVSRAGVVLYFTGIFIWFILRLRKDSSSLFIKIGLPVVLLMFSFFLSSQQRTLERVTESVSTPVEWGKEYRLLLYRDTLGMIEDAPLTGVGVGNFSAVFPQYRDASRNPLHVVHPESDVFWLAAEGGLLAISCFGLFLFAYFKRCRTSTVGRSGAYRAIALTALILFILHGLVDVSGHRPGTAYFAILFAALALPQRSGRARPTFKPLVWRVVGGTLLLVGTLWMASGLFSLPFHSKSVLAIERGRIAESLSVADYERALEAASALVDLQPLAWKGYFQRAQIILAQTGNHADAAQDFRRASFVEPTLGVVSYEEGEVWLPYDVGRTISAWRETLFRDIENKNQIYEEMLRAAHRQPALLERMIELSRLDSNYRSRLILSLQGEAFMQELSRDLRSDPGLVQFSREERTALLEKWITHGSRDAGELYLDLYGETVNQPRFIWSLLRKEQGQFQDAVEVAREAVPIVELPRVERSKVDLIRLKRDFSYDAKDLMDGTALLRAYVDEQDYAKALQVAVVLLEVSSPPQYVYYWHAELLYQMGDYLESWFAFEAYIKQKRSQ